MVFAVDGNIGGKRNFTGRNVMMFDPHTAQTIALMQTSFDIMHLHINDKAAVLVANVDITVGGEFVPSHPEQCYLDRFDPR